MDWVNFISTFVCWKLHFSNISIEINGLQFLPVANKISEQNLWWIFIQHIAVYVGYNTHFDQLQKIKYIVIIFNELKSNFK